jgi:hypothetical protein
LGTVKTIVKEEQSGCNIPVIAFTKAPFHCSKAHLQTSFNEGFSPLKHSYIQVLARSFCMRGEDTGL